jgi:hypothetical protein
MNRESLRRLFAVAAGGTAVLLLLVAAAMQFTDEVAWGWGDFLVAGVLLFSAAVAIGVAHERLAPGMGRKMVLGAIVLGAALVWAELAVGLLD